MPDGRVHSSVSVLTAGYAAVVLVDRVVVGSSPPHSLLAVLGCLSGIFLSPDLDLDGGFIGDSILKRRAGCLISGLYRMYWKPYALLIPHRSWVSHMPIVSTAIRLVYAFWWVVLIPGVVDRLEWFGWFAVGLMVVDFNHAFLDFVRPDGSHGEE